MSHRGGSDGLFQKLSVLRWPLPRPPEGGGAGGASLLPRLRVLLLAGVQLSTDCLWPPLRPVCTCREGWSVAGRAAALLRPGLGRRRGVRGWPCPSPSWPLPRSGFSSCLGPSSLARGQGSSLVWWARPAAMACPAPRSRGRRPWRAPAEPPVLSRPVTPASRCLPHRQPVEQATYACRLHCTAGGLRLS